VRRPQEAAIEPQAMSLCGCLLPDVAEQAKRSVMFGAKSLDRLDLDLACPLVDHSLTHANHGGSSTMLKVKPFVPHAGPAGCHA
jgi:hypothetical protein